MYFPVNRKPSFLNRADWSQRVKHIQILKLARLETWNIMCLEPRLAWSD